MGNAKNGQERSKGCKSVTEEIERAAPAHYDESSARVAALLARGLEPESVRGSWLKKGMALLALGRVEEAATLFSRHLAPTPADEVQVEEDAEIGDEGAAEALEVDDLPPEPDADFRAETANAVVEASTSHSTPVGPEGPPSRPAPPQASQRPDGAAPETHLRASLTATKRTSASIVRTFPVEKKKPPRASGSVVAGTAPDAAGAAPVRVKRSEAPAKKAPAKKAPAKKAPAKKAPAKKAPAKKAPAKKAPAKKAPAKKAPAKKAPAKTGAGGNKLRPSGRSSG